MTVGELIGDFSHNSNLSKEDKKLLALSMKHQQIILKFVDVLSEIENL